jgi:predicted extracellular nuclease
VNDSPSTAAAPTNWQTQQVASGNLLNLALPGQAFCANQDPDDVAEYTRKRDWLGAQFARLNADVLGAQEVFNDHLHEGRERRRSGHGFVRALLRWRTA